MVQQFKVNVQRSVEKRSEWFMELDDLYAWLTLTVAAFPERDKELEVLIQRNEIQRPGDWKMRFNYMATLYVKWHDEEQM